MTELMAMGFINSIIHWISEFPNSPLKASSSFHDLCNIATIFKLLKVLLNEEDVLVSGDEESLLSEDTVVTFHNSDIIVPYNILRKIEITERALKNHIHNNYAKLKKIEGIRLIFVNVNLTKIVIFNDISAIARMCELLLKIGIYSSKLSTFGLTSIEFLSDADKEAIYRYAGADFKDIKIENTPIIEKMEEMDRYQMEVLQKLEDEKNLEMMRDSKRFFEEKTKLEDDIKALQQENEALEKKCSDFFNCSDQVSFIEEDLVDSINWENQQLQELIYKLMVQ